MKGKLKLEKNIPALKQIDTLQYKNLTVPVMQVSDPDSPFYKGAIILESDLPEDLAKAFFWGWHLGSTCPAPHAAYMHDFVDFMTRRGWGLSGDWSAVVAQYVWITSEALELHRQEIREAVQRFGMANPRVTGAALRYEDAIDLDLLVDPVSPTIATDLPELQTYLSKLLGVPVNIIVPGSLPQLARATAVAEAKPV